MPVGADLCDDYVRRAKQVCCRSVDGDFHLADAFEFTPTTACHGAFNWYSSFGYSHCDGRNQQMLHRAYERCCPAAGSRSTCRTCLACSAAFKSTWCGTARPTDARFFWSARAGSTSATASWNSRGPGTWKAASCASAAVPFGCIFPTRSPICWRLAVFVIFASLDRFAAKSWDSTAHA